VNRALDGTRTLFANSIGTKVERAVPRRAAVMQERLNAVTK
jgi:hypothetical protein